MHFQNHMHCRPKHQCSLIFAAPVSSFFSFLCEAHLTFSQFATVDPVDFFFLTKMRCAKKGASSSSPLYLFWVRRRCCHAIYSMKRVFGPRDNLCIKSTERNEISISLPLLWLIKFDGKSRIRSDANENHLLSSSKVSSTHWPRRNGQLEMIWGHS